VGDRSHHLVEHARQRSADTRRRVREAIRQLDRAGEPVTFVAVARAASVSRAWLYRAPDLRSEIERLRRKRPASPKPLPAAQRASPESSQRRIEALLDANRALREENRVLNDRLASLLGEHRDARRRHVTDDETSIPRGPRRSRSR
jgi:FtsZ-binding cell division protein ZapB